MYCDITPSWTNVPKDYSFIIKTLFLLLVRSLFRYDWGAQPIHGWWVPVAQCIKRGWGPWLAVRGSPRHHTPHPTNPNPTRGSTGAVGSSATATAEDLLLDPTYTVPPPGSRPHRSWHRRPRATAASPVSSRGRPCDHDLRDGVQPRWSASLHSLCSFFSCIRCCRSRSGTCLSWCLK
jgi:hypothetical protein